MTYRQPKVSTQSNFDETLAAKSISNTVIRSRILFSSGFTTNKSSDRYSATTALVPFTNYSLYKKSILRRIQAYESNSRTSYFRLLEEKNKVITGTRQTITGKILQELKEEKSQQEIGKKKKNQNTITEKSKMSNSKSYANNDFFKVLSKPEKTLVTKDSDTGPNTVDRILKETSSFNDKLISKPKWHAPWKLSTVLSSHLGWVRSIAFDPTNDFFATGSADRTIKFFDFAKSCVGSNDALKITLTGHISPVRCLEFSTKFPYLFSAGEDKTVKCWDLESNQVVRNYHGHLSGVFSLKLHPELNILVTGGRDAVARVWDVRTKQEVYCLTGHDNTVGSILTKSVDPQVITGSYDSTIKLWDLVAGKTMTTLTHHKKSVRALVQPTFENSFLSCAADTLKKWKGRDGIFMKNFSGHHSVINAAAINESGVAISAADDGTMSLWDYSTGYCFQSIQSIVQPGSLDAENAIFAAEFDLTGTRLVTGEADKTIKIWKEDEDASEETHPVDIDSWKKKCSLEVQKRC